MKDEKLNLNGVCFGEVLWDNLPEGRKLGGAPFNVAYHLNKLGIHAKMLSRVGTDANGDDIVELSTQLGLPLDLVQRDTELPTSTVEVHIQPNKDVRYEIVFPVAWDNITCGEKEIEAVRNADFFVFGSLSTRNDPTYQSLKTLLMEAQYKVLDVNLRPPFYTQERIFELLRYADLVKMNEEEQDLIAEWLTLPHGLNDREKAEHIMDAFQIPELIVTFGAAGAIYHSTIKGFSFHFPAMKIDVVDTIGSGDSFLAAFLSQRCRRDKEMLPEEILEFAATLSGFVTQSAGACPSYDAATINRFQWMNPIFSV